MVRFNARVSSEIAIVMKILVASHVEVLLRNFTCATNNLYCYFFAGYSEQASPDYIELPLYPNISRTAKFDAKTGKKAGRFFLLLFLPNKGVNSNLLLQSIGRLLCGPVILKVDSGPCRMEASAESITQSTKFLERGLFILMGLPNATSVQQEMDIIYQSFKSATFTRGEQALLTRKLMLRGREQQENRRMNNNESPQAPLSIGLKIWQLL